MHTFTALQLKADTSPKPSTPITVISPICPSQWQVSWSCSLYSFSHKSLLIVSLRGCCASPALGLWQGADLLLVFSPLQSAWTWEGGGKSLKKKHNRELQLCKCQSRTSHRHYAHGELTCPHLIAVGTSVTEVLTRQAIITISTSTTGQMTLEPGPIVLTWSSFIALLS